MASGRATTWSLPWTRTEYPHRVRGTCRALHTWTLTAQRSNPTTAPSARPVGHCTSNGVFPVLGPRSTVLLVALAQRQMSPFPWCFGRETRHTPCLPRCPARCCHFQELAENMSPVLETSPCKLNFNVAGQAAFSCRLARFIQCAWP